MVGWLTGWVRSAAGGTASRKGFDFFFFFSGGSEEVAGRGGLTPVAIAHRSGLRCRVARLPRGFAVFSHHVVLQ